MGSMQGDKARILPMILAGGVGARLAPVSSAICPKPFVPLPQGDSLLSRTVARVNDAMFARPMLVGRAADRFALLNHAREVGVLPSAILLEPEPKNTALAIAAAVAHVLAAGEGETMLAVLPADHLITPEATWRDTVRQASRLAREKDTLCLVGITPRAADSNYGYMLCNENGAVTRFVEKPADASSLIAQGALVNAGQFLGTAVTFARLFEQHAPEIWNAAKKLPHRSRLEWEFTLLDTEPYQNATSLPFDRAVVEKVGCVAAQFLGDWSDLGTLEAWEKATGVPIDHYKNRPPRTDRPWGYFESLAEEKNRLEKRLALYPECRISRQRHQHRDETWEVIEGIAHVELGEQKRTLKPGERITITAGQWHRLANPGKHKLTIYEAQSGAPDETDIERAEDDYGRI